MTVCDTEAVAAGAAHPSAASREGHHVALMRAQTGAPAAARLLPRCGQHHSPGRPTACLGHQGRSRPAPQGGGGLPGAAGSAGPPLPANDMPTSQQRKHTWGSCLHAGRPLLSRSTTTTTTLSYNPHSAGAAGAKPGHGSCTCQPARPTCFTSSGARAGGGSPGCNSSGSSASTAAMA